MIINHQYEDCDYPNTLALLNGKPLENVMSYIYLGCEINCKECTTGNTELNLRSDAADCKFYALTHNLLNKKINLKIRVTMLNAIVRSRLVYGCQVWNVTQAQMKKMCSKYSTMLRKMTKGGYKRKENSWSFLLTNNDLIRISNTISLEDFIKKQQRNYVGHIIRKNNTSIVKRLMFNDDISHMQGPQLTVLSKVIKNEDCTPDKLFTEAMNRKF